MRTHVWTIGIALIASTCVLAQKGSQDIAESHALDRVSGIAMSTKSTSNRATARGKAAHAAAAPNVRFYTIVEGEDEDFPPGLYATFTPTAPDTVMVFDNATAAATSYMIDAGREMIHGDSGSVLADVSARKDLYAGSGALPASTTKSFVSRSGYIPIDRLGRDRFKFAIKPSHFRIAPGAMISASVQLEGDEDLRAPLCTVSAIDYEHNTFTIETSKKVPVGETINWVIINFPE